MKKHVIAQSVVEPITPETEHKACGGHCIRIQNIGVKFGEQIVLENVNLHIHCGKLTAVIGRNGAGKSTLVKAILGEIPHTGKVDFYHTHSHCCDLDEQNILKKS